ARAFSTSAARALPRIFGLTSTEVYDPSGRISRTGRVRSALARHSSCAPESEAAHQSAQLQKLRSAISSQSPSSRRYSLRASVCSGHRPGVAQARAGEAGEAGARVLAGVRHHRHLGWPATPPCGPTTSGWWTPPRWSAAGRGRPPAARSWPDGAGTGTAAVTRGPSGACLAGEGLTLLPPARKGEAERAGSRFFKPLRQTAESIFDTCKDQID